MTPSSLVPASAPIRRWQATTAPQIAWRVALEMTEQQITDKCEPEDLSQLVLSLSLGICLQQAMMVPDFVTGLYLTVHFSVGSG
mgnify:CR=1 FL=1